MQVPAFLSSRPPLNQLFETLAKERQMLSLIEKEVLAGSGSFVFDNTNWVKLWYDPGYAVASDCGTMTAYRAITADGDLLWFVFGDGKKLGFHATETDPVAAMEEAKAAWAHRKAVRTRWDEVEEVSRDLWRGTQKFDVRIEDAHASPLCTQGIEGFMGSVGLGGLTRISGRTAAMMMKIEPQVGFVIFEAWQRHLADTPDTGQAEAEGALG